MLILTIRTDKPEAEVGLYEEGKQLDYHVWQAHRALAETLHAKINLVLSGQGRVQVDIGGIVTYKGPGSFTGLRIGLSVANALAYSLQVPIVGIEGQEGWLERGLAALQAGQDDTSAMPEYGAPVHITKPRT